MKLNFLCSLMFLLTLPLACAHSRGPATTATSPAPFIRHTENKPMQSYLAMNLPYAHYEELRKLVEKSEGLALKNRGEAHITVISPVEYDNTLKAHLNIEEIHTLAERAGIQNISYREVCIGRGQKILQGKPEKTFYIVVKSPGLLKLRQVIKEAFIAHGGHEQDFHPEAFYPHVTLGFTARDLHFEEGVIKNEASCFAPIPR